MSKQNSRGTVVALSVFAGVFMTAAFAGSNHAAKPTKAEFAAASPSATPPAENKAASVNKKEVGRRTNPSATQPAKEINKTVATCNTANGCQALKDACKSLKKHSFKATNSDGSLGMCIDQNPASSTFYLRNSNAPNQPPKNPAADVGLAAPKNTSEATLYCHGAVICRKVKNICAALGGNYQPIYDLSGSCSY